ncbi:MAG: helix-turn-helix domain-containing protein [Thermodesulfobacteriota bacterium]
MSIREFAAKMGVSEKTIYRMLNDNQIPFAVKIGGQWRFRIDAVDGWLAGQGGGAPATEEANYKITVRAALSKGSVLYRIHGDNRDEALDELLATLPHTGGLDTVGIKVAILAQEALAASCLHGIACMRPGRNAPFFVAESLIILAFLEKPTDFRARDRQKAEIVILVLAANEVEEAILDTHLRRLLMEADFRAALKAQPPRRELLELVQQTEDRLLPPVAAKKPGRTRAAASSGA